MYNSVVTTTLARSDLDLTRSARLFHALSDETRLAILDLLRGGERCVCELQDALDAAQSRLSFHLKVLRDAELVTDRKEGRWTYYALDLDRVGEAQIFLRDLEEPRTTLHQLTRSTGQRKPSASARQKAQRDGCCT